MLSLSGLPIRVEIRRSLGPHSAATSIPGRLILLDAGLLATRGEFERILVHELFHFAWVRLSNQTRREWEAVLAEELAAGVCGELGWSAEWRKAKLNESDPRTRTRRWRLYACESFCDTAAWSYTGFYTGLAKHDEFTLPQRARRRRQRWFQVRLADPLPV